MPGPKWTYTLRDILGASLAEVNNEDIKRLVTDGVRETAELDFKATLYGKEPVNKIELCKDIAGMRNHSGGVTILGVAEKDAVANGCPEVALSDAEERRMRQVVASGTAPHVAFEIRRIPGKSSSKGFYLLIAEPSPLRPHAVLVDDGLRYPRRDGTTTRYLSEAEVADTYRDRFRGEKQQIERLGQITEETIAQLDRSEERMWLVISLIPNMPGDLSISFAGRTAIENWARQEHSGRDVIDDFFTELPPVAGVSVERYTLKSPADRGKPAKDPYAACFTDGAVSASQIVSTIEIHQGASNDKVVLAPHLVCRAAAALRLIGRHALRAGARGDVVVSARVFGPYAFLGWNHSGITEPYSSSVIVREARAELTLPLDALGGVPQDLLAATRLVLTDIFNGFGCPEVPQITSDGTLRTKFFPAGYQLDEWAERRGVMTSNLQVLE